MSGVVLFCMSSYNPLCATRGIGDVTLPISKMGKRRPREAKQLAQCHSLSES